MIGWIKHTAPWEIQKTTWKDNINMDIKESEIQIYSTVSRNGPVLALTNKVFKLRWPCKFLRQFSDCHLRNKDVVSQRRLALHFVDTSNARYGAFDAGLFPKQMISAAPQNSITSNVNCCVLGEGHSIPTAEFALFSLSPRPEILWGPPSL